MNIRNITMIIEENTGFEIMEEGGSFARLRKDNFDIEIIKHKDKK